MQTETVESAHTKRVRRVAICLALLFAVLCAATGAAALGWWKEAFLPMTAEKYAIYCGANTPECYPEIWFVLSALFMSAIAIGAGVLTGFLATISFLPDRFLNGTRYARPTA